MEFIAAFFKNFYQKWMAFAEKLQKFFQTVIFGGIYFLFLPFMIIFRTKDRLGLHVHKKKRTFWIDRSQPVDTLEHMQLMG